MRKVLHEILIWAIDRLVLNIVLGLRRMFGSIDLFNQVTLRAAHPIQQWVARLGLIDKMLNLLRELTHVRSMAAKALGFVFSCRRGQERVEGSAKRRGMDRTSERRGFPLFKHPLMTTFTLAGTRKGLFEVVLRFGRFLREQAAPEPRLEE